MFSDRYQHAPIAIYDSGIGGLAIAKAIKALLPEESIHYIADTKNFPYGQQKPIALRSYVTEVVNFCLSKGYKLLVIACNTATAAANDFLPSYLTSIGAEMGIVNVIDPVIHYIIHNSNCYKRIGLIGTSYTVACKIYLERLRTTDIRLTSLPTPLLAPMVEAYFKGRKLNHFLLAYYLEQIACPNLDAVIPACTHYIFLEKAIKNFLRGRYQQEIEVIDVAKLTALAVQQFLNTSNRLNKSGKRLSDCFMATALTPAFREASKKLFAETGIEISLTDDTACLDFRSYS